jgi:hypothetical protein
MTEIIFFIIGFIVGGTVFFRRNPDASGLGRMLVNYRYKKRERKINKNQGLLFTTEAQR